MTATGHCAGAAHGRAVIYRQQRAAATAAFARVIAHVLSDPTQLCIDHSLVRRGIGKLAAMRDMHTDHAGSAMSSTASANQHFLRKSPSRRPLTQKVPGRPRSRASVRLGTKDDDRQEGQCLAT